MQIEQIPKKYLKVWRNRNKRIGKPPVKTYYVHDQLYKAISDNLYKVGAESLCRYLPKKTIRCLEKVLGLKNEQ